MQNSQEFIAEQPVLERNEVKRLLASHGFAFASLVSALGDKPLYDTADVLAWMGY